MGDLLTIKETAIYLKLNYMTVYKLAQKGKIPASKVGGNWRIDKDTLGGWLEKQSRLVQGRVLVVDDDARVRDILADVASGQGYEVITAGTGELALEQAERQRFDLIFLDLVLPGMTGVQVLKELKLRGNKSTVAIVTGYGDDPLAMEAISLGPMLLIRKPFRVNDIVEVLRLAGTDRR